MPKSKYQIITFYQFKKLENLTELKNTLRDSMREISILGTIVLAEEGYNATVSGPPESIKKFIDDFERIFETELTYKSSFHSAAPFKRAWVKIKPEIVTLKQKIDIRRGAGTHVTPEKWNEIIKDEDAFVLDARNDYECGAGTFPGAVNPQTKKFSDLPAFVKENLNPQKHKKIALFCTGGIRCEKFAPFMKKLGFEEVYQLEGGILRYLAEIPAGESLWRGDCFVFDERVTLDERMKKGKTPDFRPKKKR